MSAMIAEVAGRVALLQKPTRKATTAMATWPSVKPSTAVNSAVPSCAATSVGRRPIRSLSTPATSEANAEPRPNSEATSPA